MITLQDIEIWRRKPEDEHLEFKEAKNRFDFELLVKYCCALANEGGGRIVMGMTDKLPRHVCGTMAFPEIVRTKAGVGERLRLRVNAFELMHPEGRVIVFDVPPRPRGVPIEYHGCYWMRRGEELVGMTTDQLQMILTETVLDHSATAVHGAQWEDLDPKAIKRFRELWIRKARRSEVDSKPLAERLKKLSEVQLLKDVGLVNEEGITVAALVLLGKSKSLERLLANAEVVFEYRNSKASGPAQFRKEFREGFYNYYDELWELINRWNTKQSFQDGFAVLDIRTFNERIVREAILNAVSHRDYRHAGSIFIRVNPMEIQIESPGGFPAGVAPATLYRTQNPRNRRIAEAFARSGFVERSGQGVNLMIELSIQEGKSLPEYTEIDGFQVQLRLDGKVRDTDFAFALRAYSEESGVFFSTEDLMVLDLVRRKKPIPKELREQLDDMLSLGLVVGFSRGRGRIYAIGERLIPTEGDPIDELPPNVLHRDDAKTRILSMIEVSRPKGVSRADIASNFPSLSDGQVKGILRELKELGKIEARGLKKGSRWFIVVNGSKKE